MEYESKMPEWHHKRNVCLILFQSQVTLLDKTHLQQSRVGSGGREHTPRPNCHKAIGQLCDLPGPEFFHLSMGLASQGCCVKEPILGKGEVSVGVQS